MTGFAPTGDRSITKTKLLSAVTLRFFVGEGLGATVGLGVALVVCRLIAYW